MTSFISKLLFTNHKTNRTTEVVYQVGTGRLVNQNLMYEITYLTNFIKHNGYQISLTGLNKIHTSVRNVIIQFVLLY